MVITPIIILSINKSFWNSEHLITRIPKRVIKQGHGYSCPCCIYVFKIKFYAFCFKAFAKA